MSNFKKIKVGLLGLGRVAEHHKKYLKNNKYLEVVSCCDFSKKKLISYQNFYNIKDIHQSIKSFSKSKVYDLAIISTPSGLHSLHSGILLKNRKHVLVEKPASLRPNDHLKLSRYAKTKKLFYDVILQNRYNSAIVFLKKILLKKTLGKILKINVRVNWCRDQNYYNDKWHGKWKLDGGVICQQAYHHIDILSNFFPGIKDIYAKKFNLSHKLQAEDTFVANCILKNNIILNFEATTAIKPHDIEANVVVFGSRGLLEIGGVGMNKILNYSLDNNKILNFKKYNQNFPTGYGLSHLKLFNEVGKKIRNKSFSSIFEPREIEQIIINIHNFYKASEIKKSIRYKKYNIYKNLGMDVKLKL